MSGQSRRVKVCVRLLKHWTALLWLSHPRLRPGIVGSQQNAKEAERKCLIGSLMMNTFHIPVWISTSVLDCGITLHAGNVSNLVICQPDQICFRQMLGRIRVKEGDRINLYIQAYSPKQVAGYAHTYDQDFCFLTHFRYINDDRAAISRFKEWPEPNIIEGGGLYVFPA